MSNVFFADSQDKNYICKYVSVGRKHKIFCLCSESENDILVILK